MGSKGSGALAKVPSSTIDWKSIGSALPFRMSKLRPSGRRNSAIDMRFWVNVPVLSVHRTVVDPSVSIAAARRASTRTRDRRIAPIAMNTASTTGNSSGSSAIPSAMPARAPSSQLSRSNP